MLRTPVEALAALKAYEDANSDIPHPTLRLMALGAFAYAYGRRVLEAALEQRLPRLPFRDHSWRYWKCLELSGLGHCWDAFRDTVHAQGIRKACAQLRRTVPRDQYKLFRKRQWTTPHSGKGVRDKVWTKGGVWRRESRFTQVLVLKQHLPRRTCLKPWHYKVEGPVARLVEKELMGLIKPDQTFPFEARQQAVDYVRRRIPELLGRKRALGMEGVAWFFQQDIPIPHPRDGHPAALVPDPKTGYVHLRRRTTVPRYWEW